MFDVARVRFYDVGLGVGEKWTQKCPSIPDFSDRPSDPPVKIFSEFSHGYREIPGENMKIFPDQAMSWSEKLPRYDLV